MRWISVCVLFLGITAVPCALRSQNPVPADNVPLCKPAEIDATFSFADAPAGRQEVGVHLHNVTPQACRLRGELAPNFASIGQTLRLTTCWLCSPEGVSDAAAVRREDEFFLRGDGYAWVTYRWSSAGDKCQAVDWFTAGAVWDGLASYLFLNRHWKPHVCSTVQISGYEGDPGVASASGVERGLTVTGPPGPLYEDEFVQVTLHLSPGQGVAMPARGCAELYGVYQNSSGSTRFEAILPDGYSALVLHPADQPSLYFSSGSDALPAEYKDYQRVCATGQDRDTATVTLPASLKAPVNVIPTPNLKDLRHIVWRVENAGTQEPAFVTADTHFDIRDPDTLAQNWGPQVEGIGAGLSVDKLTFTFGEVIPLHLRWENFAAKQRLAVGECGGEPGVEIQDADHDVLGLLNTDMIGICSMHGWGPISIEPRKAHREFARLIRGEAGYSISGNTLGITEPGVYFLTAVWSPPTLVEKSNGLEVTNHEYSFGERYATARSLPVRIEILPSEH